MIKSFPWAMPGNIMTDLIDRTALPGIGNYRCHGMRHYD